MQAMRMLTLVVLLVVLTCCRFVNPPVTSVTWAPLPTIGPAFTPTTPPPTATATSTPMPTRTATPRSDRAATALAETKAAQSPTAPPTATPEVLQGWRGTVHRAPAGTQYDDYFRVLGGAGGEYGIASPDKNLDARLVALRDSGRVINVWGVLQRGVADHGGVRIVVDRLEEERPPATPVPASEPVEGWVGRIQSAPVGASYDDCFERQSPLGQYGIVALMPRLEQEIISHRNTGTRVRVWGMLDYGVADCAGKRIIITRIEVIGP